MESTVEIPEPFEGADVRKEFIPTPEKISQYLELETDQVRTMMGSVEGRKDLYKQLLVHEELLSEDHDNFDSLALQTQLEDAGEALSANERYLKEVQSPEQKSAMKRAWEAVKKFPRNHPVVTALLAASVVAGGVAGGFYLTGNLEYLLSSIGLGHLYGAEGAGAAAGTMGELIDGASKIPDYFDGPGGGSML